MNESYTPIFGFLKAINVYQTTDLSQSNFILII